MTFSEASLLEAGRIAQLNAEQRLLVSRITEASFIGASPNKIETVRVSGDDEVDIFEDTINETKIRYASTGLIISPANPPEWVKDYVHGVNMQWYGEFKRTRYEQENIEFYTQKELV